MSERGTGGGLRVAIDDVPDPVEDVPAGDGAEQTAVFAGGCFWCVEAVFRPVEGVLDVVSGYAGGTAATADYRSVCSGRTDHAEAVAIRFDPRQVSYGQLLKLFFSIAHDPTQKDRQGPDVGRQYRSAIFTTGEEQRRVARAYIEQLDRAGVFGGPIVTEVAPLEAFYPGEEYHQDYAARNPEQPYILYQTAPKMAKLRRHFGERLRRE